MTIERVRLSQHRHGPRRTLPVLAFVVIVAIGAGVLTLANPFPGSDDAPASRFTEAVVGAPDRINPLFVYRNDVDRDIASLVFSGLTRLGAGGEILPDLAQSWRVSTDERTFTFQLRPDIFWHSDTASEPFTAADVLFTYDLLADPDLQGDPNDQELWRQVECAAPDELTVQCELPQPYAPFLSFATVGILPEHILGDTDAASLSDHPFNRAPVGTGPFRLVQMNSSRAILKANPGYHLGQPQMDEIEIRFYADTSAAVAALAGGEVLALLLDDAASRSDFDELSVAANLKAHTSIRTEHTVLYLNNDRPPFDDPLVRNAIARAVDIDAILGGLRQGNAVRAYSPIVPGTWAFNPDIEPYSYDTAAAAALLDAAGWLLPENADVRVRDGAELRISLVSDRESLAREIAGQLADVGIAATVVVQDTSKLVRDTLLPRRYQAAIFGWESGPDPDPYPAWHSSQAGDGGRNLADYVSARADLLLEEARRTTDQYRRQELYYNFQAVFYSDVPSLPLYYPVDTYFVSERLLGLELGTLFYSSSRFNNVHEWSLEKDLDFRDP